MQKTELTYLQDTYLFEDTAQIISIDPSEEADRHIITLNKTIFYPQGGGQPYDQGIIKTDTGTFNVHEVRFDSGQVLHIGTLTLGNIEPGQQARMRIDSERRLLNARIHSAGHLLDIAVQNIGLNLIPGKGYHFPDGPYVEYEGSIETDKREELIAQLEQELQNLISQNIEITTQLASLEELPKLCSHIPEYIPKDKPSRVVTISGNPGCPCGGTHIKNISELGSVIIRKLSSKKGITRISYQVEDKNN